MANQAPDYRITLDGRDLTPKLQARLMDLTLTETRGDEADQLDLILSDHDGALQIPRKGVTLTLSIGWAGADLVDKGTFVVDEAEHSGAPDVITIRARSAELGQALRTRAEHSYHATTLGTVLRQIAGRHKLKPRIDAGLAARPVAHIDQTHESDINFLTRLAKLHDAVATVKRATLIFLPILGTTTSTGQPLPSLTITRASGDGHRFATSDREAYSGVRAYWHDPRRAKRRGVLVGKSGNAKKLRESSSSEAEARSAAVAAWRRLQRGLSTLELRLAIGQPLLAPQTPVTVRGFKAEIDEIEWLASKVTHSIGNGGFTTQVTLEMLDADPSTGGVSSDAGVS
ncbi:MAG: phage late control D family protein [Rubrivivax sp.]|nr:MAG: phage late control D family protein [Rubrivivax sp.]